MSEIHSNAEAFVVGALDASEAAEFQQHLTGCADCREEVASMREITAQLSQSVAADPPPSLRASILDQIAATPQDAAEDVALPEPRAGRHTSPGAAPTAHSSAAAADSNVVPIKRHSWARRAPALVAAAAVLAAIAIGGWAIQSRNEARDQTATANEQIAQLTTVLAAPDVQTVSAPATDGGTTTVVRSADQGVALLVASDLPDLPSGKVYEAWTFDGETPVAAGTFGSGADSTHQLPSAGVNTATVAVTVEADGGSDVPTSDPVAVIDLS